MPELHCFDQCYCSYCPHGLCTSCLFCVECWLFNGEIARDITNENFDQVRLGTFMSGTDMFVARIRILDGDFIAMHYVEYFLLPEVLRRYGLRHGYQGIYGSSPLYLCHNMNAINIYNTNYKSALQ